MPSPPTLPHLHEAEQQLQHPQPGVGDVPQRTRAPGKLLWDLTQPQEPGAAAPSQAGLEQTPPVPARCTPALVPAGP